VVAATSTKQQRMEAAQEAFMAFRAMQLAEIASPALCANSYWQGIKADAYADFTELFWRIG